jgi:hypothetical protein
MSFLQYSVGHSLRPHSGVVGKPAVATTPTSTVVPPTTNTLSKVDNTNPNNSKSTPVTGRRYRLSKGSTDMPVIAFVLLLGPACICFVCMYHICCGKRPVQVVGVETDHPVPLLEVEGEYKPKRPSFRLAKADRMYIITIQDPNIIIVTASSSPIDNLPV